MFNSKPTAMKLRVSGGIQAQATILTATRGHDVHESGPRGRSTVHWKMRVRVEVISITPFEADVEGELPADNSYGPGLTVPVIFDPSKQSKIVFDDTTFSPMGGFGQSGQYAHVDPNALRSLVQDMMSNPAAAAGRQQELLAAFGRGGAGATVFVNGQQVSGPGAPFGAPQPTAPGFGAPAGNPSPPAADPVQLLTQLAQLHQQGVIDDAQFAAQKARLLGGSA